MMNKQISFGADIDEGTFKKIESIIKRFCKAYCFELISFEASQYHQVPDVSRSIITIEYNDLNQFDDASSEIPELLDHCIYLQTTDMFDTFMLKNNVERKNLVIDKGVTVMRQGGQNVTLADMVFVDASIETIDGKQVWAYNIGKHIYYCPFEYGKPYHHELY